MLGHSEVGRQELPTKRGGSLPHAGGLDGVPYAWGNEFAPGGKQMADTWQGEFPWENLISPIWDRHAICDAWRSERFMVAAASSATPARYWDSP